LGISPTKIALDAALCTSSCGALVNMCGFVNIKKYFMAHLLRKHLVPLRSFEEDLKPQLGAI
jgi:hypothetical protein